MTDQEYTTLTTPEKWKLIALYQNKCKVWRFDENDMADMKLFFEWLIKK